MNAHLIISYDVWSRDSRDLVATYSTSERAIEHAKQHDNLYVNMTVDLTRTDTGESLPWTEDYLLHIRVWPDFHIYDSNDLDPVLNIQEADNEI